MTDACTQTIYQAISYIGRKTQHWSSARHAACRRSARFVALETDVYTAAETGDVAATQAACRTWWTWILAFVEEREVVEA